jgi:hypothetical protein
LDSIKLHLWLKYHVSKIRFLDHILNLLIMKKIIQNLVMSGVVGSVAVAAPFLAIGDKAELFATAETSVAYNDNLLLSRDGQEVEDTIFTVVPGFDLSYGKDGAVTGNLLVSETLTSYADNTNLNNQLFATSGTAAFDNEKLKLGANASFTETDQATVDNASSTSSTGKLIEHHDTAAGVNGELRYSEKISFGAGFTYSNVAYIDAGNVDSTDYSVPVNVYYELTPKVDVSTGVTYTHTELDGVTLGNSSQYDAYYYNVGSRGSFTPKLTGNYSVGYNMRDGNGTATSDDKGSLGAKADLAYAYSEKTQLAAGISRDFANATSGGASYQNTNFTVGASTAITVDWTLNAGLEYRILEFTSFTNNYYQGTLGAKYTINEYLTAGMSYVYRTQTSDLGATNEFAGNIVAVSLTARY